MRSHERLTGCNVTPSPIANDVVLITSHLL
jgi:hypothetical protein